MKIIEELKNKKFIEKSIKTFGDVIDFSFLDYKDQYSKVDLICKIHNFRFKVMPKKFLISKNHGCRLCFKEQLSKDLINKDYIQKCKNKFSHISYEKANVYNGCFSKGIFICKIHNVEFEQRFKDHMSGNGGCPICRDEKMIISTKYTNEEFINESKKRFPNKFTYEKTNYIYSLKPVTITCVIHGDFNIVAAEHLRRNGSCTKCFCNQGETKIMSYLENEKISYNHQKSFDGCRNPKTNNKLFFDIYIPCYNLIIEFHGAQHFRPVDWFGGKKSFINSVFRDKVKFNYCLENNINYEMIRYDEKIDDRLKDIILKYNQIVS